MDPDELRRARCRGCLVGLCVGDAFGAPVEFGTLQENLERRGPDGIVDLEPWGAYPAGTYTDDGQMSVATARGLLDWLAEAGPAHGPLTLEGHHNLAERLWDRYLAWFASGEWSGRGPGTGVLAALRDGVPGSLDAPVNVGHKGCGGVMRVAPVGLVGLGADAFEVGARAARLTHGDPTSDTAAGFYAQLIDNLLEWIDLPMAALRAREVLAARDGAAETLDAVDTAVELASEGEEPYPAIQQIGHVGDESPIDSGKGWVAEEALGIGLFCALRFSDDFAAALRAAANISGDSDSTASIAGSILGASGGLETIPARWAAQVENRVMLLELADRLAEAGRGG